MNHHDRQPRADVLPRSCPPRGLQREEAAERLRVSLQEFDGLRERGCIEPPVNIDGLEIWDRVTLRRERSGTFQVTLPVLAPIDRAADREHTGTFMYVIGPKRGPVKIGISGSSIVRLAALQIGHPFELSVLAEVAVARNGRETEGSVHRFLQPYHTRKTGEWFHRTHEVQRLIEMVYCRLSPDIIMQKLRADRNATGADKIQRRRQGDG